MHVLLEIIIRINFVSLVGMKDLTVLRLWPFFVLMCYNYFSPSTMNSVSDNVLNKLMARTICVAHLQILIKLFISIFRRMPCFGDQSGPLSFLWASGKSC